MNNLNILSLNCKPKLQLLAKHTFKNAKISCNLETLKKGNQEFRPWQTVYYGKKTKKQTDIQWCSIALMLQGMIANGNCLLGGFAKVAGECQTSHSTCAFETSKTLMFKSIKHQKKKKKQQNCWWNCKINGDATIQDCDAVASFESSMLDYLLKM